MITIDVHVIKHVFKFSNISWKEKKQVDKQTLKAMLQGVVLLGAYTNIEQWSVSKMKGPCTILLFCTYSNYLPER